MAIPFLAAKYFTVTSGRTIDLIVIHDMEWPETPTTAEGCAQMFHGANSPQASDHYNIDADSVVQSVKDKDVAWCAPKANHNGLHFEHAGFARQSRAEWLDAYGKKLLARSAKLTAAKAKAYNIPIRKLTPTQVAAGMKGFCGHVDVTKGFPGSGTHTDPGVNFPWDVYMKMVQAEYDALVGKRWTKTKIGSVAAALGVAVSVFFGVSQTSTPPAPAPVPTHSAPAPVPTKPPVKPPVKVPVKVPVKPAPKPVVPKFLGQVKQGNHGKAVLAVQKRLKARGWKIATDGNFGPKTAAIVRQFQKNHSLKVDGVVGQHTWTALWTR